MFLNNKKEYNEFIKALFKQLKQDPNVKIKDSWNWLASKGAIALAESNDIDTKGNFNINTLYDLFDKEQDKSNITEEVFNRLLKDVFYPFIEDNIDSIQEGVKIALEDHNDDLYDILENTLHKRNPLDYEDAFLSESLKCQLHIFDLHKCSLSKEDLSMLSAWGDSIENIENYEIYVSQYIKDIFDFKKRYQYLCFVALTERAIDLAVDYFNMLIRTVLSEREHTGEIIKVTVEYAKLYLHDEKEFLIRNLKN
ncbi:MAG: hypothetical protein CL760_06610 [Chloroflexi bacterium]|nr:hypothetical protein [Chloroflexota bacterium]|tara:strand:+ start:24698 stop:25456 length:759 start_codon:yes stop_codon:yes gene_type:complete